MSEFQSTEHPLQLGQKLYSEHSASDVTVRRLGDELNLDDEWRSQPGSKGLDFSRVADCGE